MAPSSTAVSELLATADAFEKVADYQSALQIYQGLVESDSANPRYWALKGHCNYLKKDFQASLADFSRAIEIRGDVPTTLFFRAQVFEELGDLDRALADYRDSTELSPRADAFMNIGLIYKYLGDLEASRAALFSALNLEPENQTVRNLLDSLAE